MEKEQIIKALAHWAKNFDGKLTDFKTLCEALTLILEQEKRIEELEKEATFWEGQADNAIDIAECNIRAEIASGGTSCHWCEDKIKVDTVRKMQEAIKERCIKGGIYPVFVKNVVEAVAKELLEDVTPPAKFLSLENVSRAIKDYCCDLIDAGKDMVEVTEFNADLQKILSREIFGKETE